MATGKSDGLPFATILVRGATCRIHAASARVPLTHSFLMDLFIGHGLLPQKKQNIKGFLPWNWAATRVIAMQQ
jgi:hypothetical protein